VVGGQQRIVVEEAVLYSCMQVPLVVVRHQSQHMEEEVTTYCIV
jgi:hypothetical protein